MHKSSMLRMGCFFDNYVSKVGNAKILDVGSYSVNGSYRDLLAGMNVQYVGLDIEKGPNVDIVMDKIYSWDSVEDESYDFVISGQAFEHIEYPWLTIQEIYKKLKPNGIVCIIAPNSLWEHKYPYDCYRYWGDGLAALAKWAGFTVLEVSVAGIPERGVSSEWDDPSNDVCLIAGKFDANFQMTDVKKIFPYERQFDIAKNYRLHYEFLNLWMGMEDRDERVKHYLQKKDIKKVYIYGYEHVGKALELTLQNIGMDYEIVETEQAVVVHREDAMRADFYPGIMSLQDKSFSEEEALIVVTIFDANRDYINYLDKIYQGVKKIYLYDLIECERYVEFFDAFSNNIYLYGAGNYGRLICERLSDWGIEIAGFVVTDGYKRADSYCEKKVYELSELRSTDAIMVSVEDGKDILKNLANCRFKNVIDGKYCIPIWKYSYELGR